MFKGDFVHLDKFKTMIETNWPGSLISLKHARELHPRAKEYLYRLSRRNEIKRVVRGWYIIPLDYRDPWDFITRDKGFKVIIKQTAASIWNYDFIHRDVIHLAVKDKAYGRALEALGKMIGWNFEVEYHKVIPYEYRKINNLYIETIESSIVSCIVDWSFIDAFATLYFRRREIDFSKLKTLSKWKRISNTDLRAWTLIKYGCSLLNEHLGRRIFKIKPTEIKQMDIKELVKEAVEKVIEHA